MLKYYFDFPPLGTRNYQKALAAKKIISALSRNRIAMDASDADVRIGIGGDGNLLHLIHEFSGLSDEMIFMGWNFGARGFMLNDIESIEQLPLTLDGLVVIVSRLLEAEFFDADGNSKTCIAFNDVYLNANHGTTGYLSVEGDKFPYKDIEGDGVIVATPQGTTAYNFNAGGVILPLTSSEMMVTDNNSRKRQTEPTPFDQNLVIIVQRGTMVAHADYERFENVVKVKIKPSERHIKLGFLKETDFEIKRINFGRGV